LKLKEHAHIESELKSYDGKWFYGANFEREFVVTVAFVGASLRCLRFTEVFTLGSIAQGNLHRYRDGFLYNGVLQDRIRYRGFVQTKQKYIGTLSLNMQDREHLISTCRLVGRSSDVEAKAVRGSLSHGCERCGRPLELALEEVGGYRLICKLGSGGWGTVYSAEHKETGQEVAIKLERTDVPGKQGIPNEAYLHNRLKEVYLNDHSNDVARMFCSGTDGIYNYLVMERLGSSLEVLKKNSKGKKLNQTTVLSIAAQLLRRVQLLHSQSHVHRDIKPANILIGRGKKSNRIYLVDFGLACRYRQWDTKSHGHVHYEIRESGTRSTPLFSSYHAHTHSQSRRDDLEGVAYTLIYLVRGDLPWQGKELQTMKTMKYEISADTLCEGLHPVFAKYLEYCKKLDFKDEPDYERWQREFERASTSMQAEVDLLKKGCLEESAGTEEALARGLRVCGCCRKSKSKADVQGEVRRGGAASAGGCRRRGGTSTCAGRPCLTGAIASLCAVGR